MLNLINSMEKVQSRIFFAIANKAMVEIRPWKTAKSHEVTKFQKVENVRILMYWGLHFTTSICVH